MLGIPNAVAVDANMRRATKRAVEVRSHTTAGDLEQACKVAGLPLGQQRLAIIRVLADACDHPTAEEIHTRARTHDGKISRATTYRTLAIFIEHGLVFGHDFGDRKIRYEDATRGPHGHIIDADTGAVHDYKNDALERDLRSFMRARGYHLRDYRLNLLCDAARPPAWPAVVSRRRQRR